MSNEHFAELAGLWDMRFRRFFQMQLRQPPAMHQVRHLQSFSQHYELPRCLLLKASACDCSSTCRRPKFAVPHLNKGP